MLKNLSEKYKFYFLLAAILVLLLICYNMAFKDTFKVWRDYKSLKDRAAVASEIPKKTAKLSSQLAELNSLFFNEKRENEDMHELILERIGTLTAHSNALLVGYPPLHLSKTSSVQIETHTIVLKGNFRDLLEIIYNLEVKQALGRIASIEFFTETDRRSHRRELFCRLYIQNFRNLKNHE